MTRRSLLLCFSLLVACAGARVAAAPPAPEPTPPSYHCHAATDCTTGKTCVDGNCT